MIVNEQVAIDHGLKKDEYVMDCSDIDDIIVFTKEGKMMITKVDSKTFIGKDIIHVEVFDKKDNRTIYNLIYRYFNKKVTNIFLLQLIPYIC